MEKLTKTLETKIKEADMETLMYDLELPLVNVLSYMEIIGFKVNKDMLDELSIKFKEEINETQKEIYILSE